MINYFYVKVNLEDWKRGNKEYFDWDIMEVDEEEEFFTYHKNVKYWLEAVKGDIIICHSSYIKVKSHSARLKFVPKPRITAISVVTKGRHTSSEKNDEVVTIKKRIHIPRPLFKWEIEDNRIISESEPYKLGTNRYTITKLTQKEYREFVNEILKKNPELKDSIEKLERE